MKVNNENELNHMLKCFYSATSPKTFKYNNVNNKRILKKRKPLLTACAVISIFIILTVFYIGISSKKDAEKGLNNKDADKGYNYLSSGPLEFVNLFEFLNYASSSFSLVDEEKLLIPQFPVPYRNMYTHIYNNNDYKYVFTGTINNNEFTVVIRFIELDVEEGKEWYELCESIEDVQLRDFNGVKYLQGTDSGSFRFYKNGIVIYCYFRKMDNGISTSEQLNIAANTTFVKPIFTEENTAKLMYEGVKIKYLKLMKKKSH